MSTKEEFAQIFPKRNICVCKYDAIQLFDVLTLAIWKQEDKKTYHIEGGNEMLERQSAEPVT